MTNTAPSITAQRIRRTAADLFTDAGTGNQWLRSYNTLVALYEAATNTLYVNDRKYSVTTTRHTNEMRVRHFTAREVRVSADELSDRLLQLGGYR